MQFKDIFLSDFMTSTRRIQDAALPYLLRRVAWIVFMGFMCARFYFYGSSSSSATIEKMDSELDDFHKTLNDISATQERYKRDLNLETHHLKKRQARDDEDDAIQTVQSGAPFIRWGRRDCENTGPGTVMVYQGIAASNRYSYHGGGFNSLCLNANVTYNPMNRYRNGFNSNSRIYGIEYYETSISSLFDYSLIESGSFYQYSLPCSMCMAPGRITQLMIPGQSECPKMWKKEYTGYIMGPHYNHKDYDYSGQYICVDEQPQIVLGSQGSQVGERLFLVETECPSLQCGPYVVGRELRCVVCTI